MFSVNITEDAPDHVDDDIGSNEEAHRRRGLPTRTHEAYNDNRRRQRPQHRSHGIERKPEEHLAVKKMMQDTHTPA